MWNYRLRINSCFLWPGYVLFFLMLFVPLTYQPIKAGLLLVILFLIAILTLYDGRLVLHPTVLLWTLFIVSVGFAFICLGLVNANPGALRVGTVYVLWPLLFTILLSRASNERVLRGLVQILAISLFAIALYNLSYILYAYGWLPDILYIPIDQGQTIGFHEGYIGYRLYNINSLFFLVPFFIAALLTWPKDIALPIRRFWIWIVLILGLIVSLLSARRGLILVIAMAPIITLFFGAFLPQSIKRTGRTQTMRIFVIIMILMLGIIIYLQYFQDISVLAVLETIKSGVNLGDSIRKEQFFALLAGWKESPLLGAGFGASVPGPVRSIKMPWAYELYYMALLFSTGLLGFLAYVTAVAKIFWMGLEMIRSADEIGRYMLPILVGMSCFLIASATNPYIGTFDYMWVIFLPITFINFWLLNRRKKGGSNLITTLVRASETQ